jgi:hypothetical protein
MSQYPVADKTENQSGANQPAKHQNPTDSNMQMGNRGHSSSPSNSGQQFNQGSQQNQGGQHNQGSQGNQNPQNPSWQNQQGNKDSQSKSGQGSGHANR